MLGGGGDDTLVGDQSDVLLEGGSGNDLLQVGSGFTASGDGQLSGIERVALTASNVQLTLASQTEGFLINGFASGSSTITGGAGSDTIVGGAGADSLLRLASD